MTEGAFVKERRCGDLRPGAATRRVCTTFTVNG